MKNVLGLSHVSVSYQTLPPLLLRILYQLYCLQLLSSYRKQIERGFMQKKKKIMVNIENEARKIK